MKEWKKILLMGCLLVGVFSIWTLLILTVDVQSWGQNGTNIGFATFNVWFHEFTGTHMWIYIVTDWLGLVPVFVCMGFGGLGLIQWGKRKSILRVDGDIIILGVYYVIVIAVYLVFEMIPINYRPILIEGIMEVSYPSSTTLLVLCVMPTLIEQSNRRVKSICARNIIKVVSIIFSVFMVVGRLFSGVHWLTDIVGGVLLSAGLFLIYKACIMLNKK